MLGRQQCKVLCVTPPGPTASGGGKHDPRMAHLIAAAMKLQVDMWRDIFATGSAQNLHLRLQFTFRLKLDDRLRQCAYNWCGVGVIDPDVETPWRRTRIASGNFPTPALEAAAKCERKRRQDICGELTNGLDRRYLALSCPSQVADRMIDEAARRLDLTTDARRTTVAENDERLRRLNLTERLDSDCRLRAELKYEIHRRTDNVARNSCRGLGAERPVADAKAPNFCTSLGAERPCVSSEPHDLDDDQNAVAVAFGGLGERRHSDVGAQTDDDNATTKAISFRASKTSEKNKDKFKIDERPIEDDHSRCGDCSSDWTPLEFLENYNDAFNTAT
jgi:hypothetical protein